MGREEREERARGPWRERGREGAKAPLIILSLFSFLLTLKDDLLRGIYGYGFERPSAIQQRAVPPMLAGRDVIAQAQSGTGKTSMLALAAVALADAARGGGGGGGGARGGSGAPSSSSSKGPHVLILSPTRELAAQTARTAAALGEHAAVRAWAAVGGASLGADLAALEGKGTGGPPAVLSGTPGRVYDLIKRGALATKGLKTLIFDEADELLGAGFKEQLYDIYRHAPAGAQVVLVSATLPGPVVGLAGKFMADPVRILVARDSLSLAGIRQFFVDVEKEAWKFDTLADLYETLTITQAVVFVNSRTKCDWLAGALRKAGFAVSAMHGDLPQRERDAIMTSFRAGGSRVLVSTDVWARGIDVAAVSLVVNYDLPPRRELYLHRIGRSGRFGRKVREEEEREVVVVGFSLSLLPSHFSLFHSFPPFSHQGVAINLVRSEDMGALRDIEAYYGTSIAEMVRMRGMEGRGARLRRGGGGGPHVHAHALNLSPLSHALPSLPHTTLQPANVADLI